MSDYCCYKYRTINKYLLDSLVKSNLYFAPKDKLNDPFDCNVDISRAANEFITEGIKTKLFKKLLSDKDLLDRVNNKVDPLGICSFSLKPDETLMWSHYGDNHKGICLRYDLPESFITSENLAAVPVTYELNAISNWLKDNIELLETGREAFIINLLKTLVTSKAPSWSYEEEARLMLPVTGPHEVPREALTDIIFGFQTTEEDEALIRSIADKYYSSVGFGRAVHKGGDYIIGAKKI